MSSLVLIAHNSRDQLLGTVTRLLAAHPKPHLVVVDNGSDDDTSDALRDRFPDVTLVQFGLTTDWTVAERAGRAFVPGGDCCVVWLDADRTAAAVAEPELAACG